MIQQALDDINEELTRRYPEREGLLDYSRLNIGSDTAVKVNEQYQIINRRIILLETAKSALESLLIDPHYPEIPDLGVNQAVYDDLTNQRSTIDAALETFTPVPEAITMEFTIGTPRPKQVE